MNSKRHSYHLGKSLSCQEPGTNTKYSSPPSPHLLFEVEHSYDTFHKLKWCKGKKQLPFIYLYGKNFVQVLNFGPGDTQCFILFTTIEILNYVQFYPKPNNHMSFFRFLWYLWTCLTWMFQVNQSTDDHSHSSKLWCLMLRWWEEFLGRNLVVPLTLLEGALPQ